MDCTNINTFPWKVIIRNAASNLDSSPKLVIQNEMTNNFVRNEDVRRTVEYLITKSGRPYVYINLGVMTSNDTDEYYLGIAYDQNYVPNNVINPAHSTSNYRWCQKNVHVVVVYLGKEIECVLSNDNVHNCINLHAIVRVDRFSLKERLPPRVIHH